MIPAFLILLAGCATAVGPKSPAAMAPRPAPAAVEVQPLDPGAFSREALHFTVSAYSLKTVEEVSQVAEEVYTQIMHETGLYSFRPAELYPVWMYREREEFLRKTGLPHWAGGGAIGRRLLLYEQDRWRIVLAHEVSHLVFREFLGEPPGYLRWLNEGLAMRQEAVYYEPGFRSHVEAAMAEALRQPMPLGQLITSPVFSEEARAANRWYLQARSVVDHLIESGSRLGFAEFMKRLKEGRTLDESLAAGYPGKFSSLADLEASWRAAIASRRSR